MAGERFALTPFGGIRWVSSNMAIYYYGVRREEVTQSRSAYAASSSTSPFVGLSARHRLSSHWSMFALLASERMDGGLRDSPIVEDE